ncbi:MAG TPA: hypothetical protein PKV43_10465 [Armatimonadota bacterium]|nr:hypothetical protein [Armatimonadota bacterium]
MSRCAIVLVWLMVSLGITITASGCSNSSKSSNPGLLEQNSIKNASDLDFVVIQMAEANGSYLVTDRSTIDWIYQLLDNAERVSGISKQIRPDMVTLVRKNGSTLSFAFGLYNPNLTWQYRSRPFVDFVKTELVTGKKHINKEQLPAFSTGQIAKNGNFGKRTILPSTRIGKLQADIDIITATYKPYCSVTQKSTWDEIANFCTDTTPGVEVVLTKPIEFRTLVGWIGPEPPHGSTALNLVALTVDRLVIYQGENQDLRIAFHSTAGNPSWYIADRLEQVELQGRTASNIYQELVNNMK